MRFPQQLPARFLVHLPVPPPAWHLPGSFFRSVRLSPAAGPGPSNRGSTGNMPPRRAWSEAEVNSLLSLVRGCGEAVLFMASAPGPSEALWQQISKSMTEAGYERTVSQCRSKWKALKQAFHSEQEKRRGAEYQVAELPFYYETMESMWEEAGRPVLGQRRMPAVDGDHITGLPPTPSAMPHASGCFPPLSLLGRHADVEQEGAEGEAGFPGETSRGMATRRQMLPLAAAATGSQETAATSEQPAAMSEQPAARRDASGTSLHGSDVTALLQNIQQVLVQMSQQQQRLLDILVNDVVSQLRLLSCNPVQAVETRHQISPQPQTHPGPAGHDAPHMPCSPGASQPLSESERGASADP